MVPERTPSARRWASKDAGCGCRNVTMFVRTRSGSHPPVRESLGDGVRQPARPFVVLGQRSVIVRRATKPAAAITPAWRMPPPSRCRASRARGHHFGGAGQHRSHWRAQTLRQATHHRGGSRRVIGRGHIPVATTAWNSRAPSMWIGTSPAAAATASRLIERPRLRRRRACGCSRYTPRRPKAGGSRPRRRRSPRRSGRSMPSSSGSSWNWTPAFIAPAPLS